MITNYLSAQNKINFINFFVDKKDREKIYRNKGDSHYCLVVLFIYLKVILRNYSLISE